MERNMMTSLALFIISKGNMNSINKKTFYFSNFIIGETNIPVSKCMGQTSLTQAVSISKNTYLFQNPGFFSWAGRVLPSAASSSAVPGQCPEPGIYCSPVVGSLPGLVPELNRFIYCYFSFLYITNLDDVILVK